MTQTVTIPLGRCYNPGDMTERRGKRWVWMASCAWWPGQHVSPDDQQEVLTPRELRWHVVGDAGQVLALLHAVPSIGRRDTAARVQWSVTDVGPPSSAGWLWAPDGRISRPAPVRYAPSLGLPTDVDVVEADAYRPPYFGRPGSEPVEVIAPWVRRPRPAAADAAQRARDWLAHRDSDAAAIVSDLLAVLDESHR